MAAGNINFIQAVLYLFRGLQICLCDNRHTDNRVHGRADIVGHGGKEVCLGVSRNPGRIAGVFQSQSLPGLFRALLRHVHTHAVIGRNPIPAVLAVYIAVRHYQNFHGPIPGDNTALRSCGLACLPGLPHGGSDTLPIVRMDIIPLGLQFLRKLFFGIADQIQKTHAVPEDRPHIPSVHPHQPAGNAADQRVAFLVLFRQLIFCTVHIMGQLKPRPVSLPVDNTVFD